MADLLRVAWEVGGEGEEVALVLLEVVEEKRLQRLKFFSTRDWAASRFLEIEAKFGKIEAKFLDISVMASRAENGLRL
eukprot:scaffold8062_cov71-Cyclotella_meneghiniana.AAC.1